MRHTESNNELDAYGKPRSKAGNKSRQVAPGVGGVVQEDTWPRIAVMGAGALGCYFGGMFARAGAPVTLIGRAQHVEAMARATSALVWSWRAR